MSSCEMVAAPEEVTEEQTEIINLGRDAILDCQDVYAEPVYVPEWGGQAYVRVITGHERDRFELSVNDGQRKNMVDIRARFVALVLSNESGERLFADSDIPKLTQKSASALDRVFGAGQILNGMTEEAVEGLAKN